ncbi:hypothetical protein J6590_074646 [Homalodisca vitripennis]|nr:hypothetical protein J6590_074646 [Homalodisca vitripennis]
MVQLKLITPPARLLENDKTFTIFSHEYFNCTSGDKLEFFPQSQKDNQRILITSCGQDVYTAMILWLLVLGLWLHLDTAAKSGTCYSIVVSIVLCQMYHNDIVAPVTLSLALSGHRSQVRSLVSGSIWTPQPSPVRVTLLLSLLFSVTCITMILWLLVFGLWLHVDTAAKSSTCYSIFVSIVLCHIYHNEIVAPVPRSLAPSGHRSQVRLNIALHREAQLSQEVNCVGNVPPRVTCVSHDTGRVSLITEKPAFSESHSKGGCTIVYGIIKLTFGQMISENLHCPNHTAKEVVRLCMKTCILRITQQRRLYDCVWYHKTDVRSNDLRKPALSESHSKGGCTIVYGIIKLTFGQIISENLHSPNHTAKEVVRMCMVSLRIKVFTNITNNHKTDVRSNDLRKPALSESHSKGGCTIVYGIHAYQSFYKYKKTIIN